MGKKEREEEQRKGGPEKLKEAEECSVELEDDW